MKNKLSLFLVLFLCLALFSGCGSTPPAATAPPATAAPAETAAPAKTAPPAETEAPAKTAPPAETEAPAETAPPETPSPYHFAEGNFKKDALGFAAEAYEYELPLCTTDEVLSYWTCLYTPEFLPGAYQDSPFPTAVEEETGVHVEYIMIDRNSRGDNFSVLLAADELPDICSQVTWFYPGVFKDAILSDHFFVNLYDYRDYMPNYMFEVMKTAATDIDLRSAVFLEDTVIGQFHCLEDQIYPTTALFIRGDWLKKLDIDRDSIITWEDTHEVLLAFQNQIPTAVYPAMLYNTITGGAEHWLFYDTLGFCSEYGPSVMVDGSGQVYASLTTDRDRNLMTEINKWFSEGLFDPNWASYDGTNNPIFEQRMEGDTFGYLTFAVSDITGKQYLIDDPDCAWMMLPDPVLEKGQTLHVGTKGTRVYYGNASVSTRCENIPLAITWLDWRYSPAGSMLMSWGPEGVTFEYDEAGNRRLTELIWNNPDFPGAITPLSWCYTNNIICDPGLDFGSAHYAYPGGESVMEAFAYYGTIQNNDYAYVWPSDCVLNAEEQEEANSIMSDMATFIRENYLAFVDGSIPMSQWDTYAAGLEVVGLDRYLAVYQQAYDNYLNG